LPSGEAEHEEEYARHDVNGEVPKIVHEVLQGRDTERTRPSRYLASPVARLSDDSGSRTNLSAREEVQMHLIKLGRSQIRMTPKGTPV
jgi:hypothetical protein